MGATMAHKYGAKACEEDGYRFPSLAERAEYRRLKLRVLAGDIADLELQPRYPLVVNGVKVAVYVGDFRYRLVADGTLVVADVKGVRTPVYALKRKLMRACHGIEITEVGGE